MHRAAEALPLWCRTQTRVESGEEKQMRNYQLIVACVAVFGLASLFTADSAEAQTRARRIGYSSGCDCGPSQKGAFQKHSVAQKHVVAQKHPVAQKYVVAQKGGKGGCGGCGGCGLCCPHLIPAIACQIESLVQGIFTCGSCCAPKAGCRVALFSRRMGCSGKSGCGCGDCGGWSAGAPVVPGNPFMDDQLAPPSLDDLTPPPVPAAEARHYRKLRQPRSVKTANVARKRTTSTPTQRGPVVVSSEVQRRVKPQRSTASSRSLVVRASASSSATIRVPHNPLRD